MASEETTPKMGNTNWEIFERVARIVSLAAIPIVIPIALAIYSARVQESAQVQAINRDYVQLAVSVLKEKKEDVNPELRDWATDLLAEHSPTKFAPSVVRGLKSGFVTFPALVADVWSRRISATSSDGKFVVTWNGRSVTVVDVIGKRQKMARDLIAAPTALELSPDASIVAVGYSSGTVSLISPDAPDKEFSFKIEEPVSGIKMLSSDEVFVMSSTGSIFKFDRKAGLVSGIFVTPRPPSNISVTAH